MSWPKGPRKDYGAPLRIWDNGGKTADRYTLLPPRSRRAWKEWRHDDGRWEGLGSSEQPFHPQGFGQHISATPGPHLGKRIHWNELPAEVQRFARLSFLGEYCPKVQA